MTQRDGLAGGKWQKWRRRDVLRLVHGLDARDAGRDGAEHLGMPAEFSYVRCQLPPQLARRVPNCTTDARGQALDGETIATCMFPGLPIAAWSRQRDAEAGTQREYMFAWIEKGEETTPARLRWQRVGVTQEGGVQLGKLCSLEPLADPAPGSSGEDAPPSRSPPPGAAPQESFAERLEKWHEKVFGKCRESGLFLERAADRKPIADLDRWRKKTIERVDLAPDSDLRRFFDEQAVNFALPGGAGHVKGCTVLQGDAADAEPRTQAIEVRRRPLPFYGEDVHLYEITDYRALPTRTACLVIDAKHGIAASLGPDSRPVHRFNKVELAHGNLQAVLRDASAAAAYVDFFCSFLYDGARRFAFPIICKQEDLRWIEGPGEAPDGDTGLLRAASSEVLGIWKLDVAKDERKRGEKDAGPPAMSHFFSALLLFGRDLFLCVFELLSDGKTEVKVEMRDDHEVIPILPVLPQTFDPDRRFQVTFAHEPGRRGDLSGAFATSHPLLKRLPPAGPPSAESADAAVGAAEFVRLFKDKDSFGLPCGPADPRLVVRDMVELRGYQDLERSRCAFGVVFKGRVDLRELRIRGSLDLSYCVFEDELLLQDAEIEGSLNLEGSVFLQGARLRGAIVKGNANLRSTLIGRSALRAAGSALELSGMHIDGDLDLRAVVEKTRSDWRTPGIRLRGTRIGGRLLLGCDPLLGRKVPSRVGGVDAMGARIEGDVSIRGGIGKSGTHTALDLNMEGAQLGGRFVCGPFGAEGWSGTLEHQFWNRLSEDQRDEASIPVFGYLTLKGATTQGDVLIVGARLYQLDLTMARIEGSVLLDGPVAWNEAAMDSKNLARPSYSTWPVVVDRGIVAPGLIVRGNFNLTGTWLGLGLDLSHAAIDGTVMANPHHTWCENTRPSRVPPSLLCKIEGDVNLTALRCKGALRLGGVSVQGTLLLFKTELANLALMPEFSEGRRGDIIPTRLGGLTANMSQIHGFAVLRYLQVRGPALPAMRGGRGVLFNGCTIMGDFVLWRIGGLRDMEGVPDGAPDPWDFSASIVGDLKLLKCTIHGDCLLSFTKVSGTIDLSDSKVIGDVSFGSRLSHHESLEGDHQLARRMRRSARASGGLLHEDLIGRAFCRQLEGRMLQAENDVILDGLSVAGDLNAPHLSVRGRLKAWARDDEDPSSTLSSALCVHGRTDLSFGRFNHVVLSTDRPQGDEGHAPHILLSRSRIETLSIPPSQHTGRPQARMDLIGLETKVWDVPLAGDAQDTPDVDRLAGLLQDSPASMWQSVEANLRKRGDDDNADAIYRKMRRRSAADALPPSQDTNGRALYRSLLWGAGGIGALWAALLLVDQAGAVPLWCWGLFAVLAVGRAGQGIVSGAGWEGAMARINGGIDHAYGALLGYGTRVLQVAVVWLAFVLAALPFYVAAENFEPSNAALAGKWRHVSAADEPARLAEARSAWRLGHVLGVVVNNHVPILSLTTNDDWSPNDDAGLTACLPGFETLPKLVCTRHAVKVKWISPESFSTAMQMVNWMLWPMFLTFIALRLWRRGAAA